MMKANGQAVEAPSYILVIDDHELRREWTKHALAGRPFRVRTASTGAEGLRFLRQVRFDAVVIGEHLKGMGVKDLVSKVHYACPETRVVVSPFDVSSERHAMPGSPGAYHCLVLATGDQQRALRSIVEKALACGV